MLLACGSMHLMDVILLCPASENQQAKLAASVKYIFGERLQLKRKMLPVKLMGEVSKIEKAAVVGKGEAKAPKDQAPTATAEVDAVEAPAKKKIKRKQ